MLNYFKTLRAQFYTTAVLPVLLGTAMAYQHGHFSLWRFLLASVGIVLINAGTNLTNEYYDFRNGVDEAIGFNTPYSGGSRTLAEGLVKPGWVLVLAISSFVLGAAIGLFLNAATAGNVVLWIGVAGVLSGFFYTAPPLRLGYRSLGEPLILLNLGPLATVGAYFVQVEAFPHPFELALLSLIPGIMMFNVLLINEFPDASGDRDAGKKTLVNRLGKSRARLIYFVCTPSVFAILLVATLAAGAPYLVLLGFLTVPFFVKAVSTLRRHADQVKELLPANANTLVMHHTLTVIISAGYVIARLVAGPR